MNKLRLVAAPLLAAALLGCPPVPHPATRPATQPATQPADAPELAPAPLADSGGLFLPVPSTGPLTGDALARARMTPDQILQSVRTFTAGDLAQSVPTTATATQSAEPPAEAVKLYLRGRALFLEGNTAQAMDALDQSLKIDPDAFTVLRLMGQVCFAASQLARGSIYLQRACRLAPEDMQVNYLLGRYWLERKDNDRSIFYLMNANRVKIRGEAQAPLISFYLARALQTAGYHAAAAATCEQFLAEAALPIAGYRYDRELSFLIDQRWAGELAAAENEMLVGDWKRALPHYRAAAADQPADPFIASRLVNAEFHGNSPAAARTAALRFITTSGGTPDSLTLFFWAANAGQPRPAHPDPRLISEIRTATARLDASHRAKVEAAADDLLGNPDAAFDVLADDVLTRPTDTEAVQRLLARPVTLARFPRLLSAVGFAVLAADDHADDLLEQFQRSLTSDTAAAWAHQGAPAIPPGPFPHFLAALALIANDGDPALIDAAFRAAADPAAGAPWQAEHFYIRWLIERERFADAQARIDADIAADRGGPNAWDLRITFALAQERLHDALTIAQQAHEKFPDDKNLRLRIARLLQLRGDYAGSDKEYADLVAADATYAPAYEGQINSLLERVRLPGPTNGQAALSAAVAWLGRLTNAVPSSIFGQITTATLYSQVRRAQEAETMMVRLVAQHPDEPEAAIALARARQAAGENAEAARGLEQSLHDHPSPALVAGLAQLYRLQDRPQEALDLVRRWAADHPAVAGYAHVAANEFAAQDKPADVIPILTTALQASPRSEEIAFLLARRLQDAGRSADAVATLQNFITANGQTVARLYELSHLYARSGQDDRAQATLRQVLSLMPTHKGAANDLGFYLADNNVHLDEAEKLVKIAVAEEPASGAYLDSLGWVYYKQGKFADAVTWLQKAVDTTEGETPQVQGHLADALYRTGNTAEAVERWRVAQTLLDSAKTPLDHDDAALKIYLEKVLAAVNANQPPALTPTAVAAPATAPRAATR